MTHTEFTAIRHELGLSQSALAALMGVQKATVQRYEASPTSPYSRGVPAPVARLMEAFKDGWRPQS